jgi:hypothetical protein
LLPASFSELQHGFGQDNEPAQSDDESNKFVDYLQNARDLLNQTSVEFRNNN